MPAIIRMPRKLFEAAETTLAYAATTHKYQGATTQFAYVLMGGSPTDRHMAYTQLTRARQQTHLFVGEPRAGKDLSQLIRSTATERTKLLAHDLGDRTH
jgi:ATP-dependent exoDNAse (exonuclease V) alpha subunit